MMIDEGNFKAQIDECEGLYIVYYGILTEGRVKRINTDRVECSSLGEAFEVLAKASKGI